MDWTAQVVADAELSDLSAEAIEVARRGFTEHNASRIPKKVIESWNDEEFLRHAGLITKRGITRACILLLGKPEAANLLTPLMAELTWKLVGQETAYEHFGHNLVVLLTRDTQNYLCKIVDSLLKIFWRLIVCKKDIPFQIRLCVASETGDL